MHVSVLAQQFLFGRGALITLFVYAMSCHFAARTFRERGLMDIISGFIDVAALSRFTVVERTFSFFSAKHGCHLCQRLLETAVAQRSGAMLGKYTRIW